MKRTVAAVVCAALAGCAVTPSNFYANKSALSDIQVCRTWADVEGKPGATSFAFDVRSEAERRGLDAQSCASKIQDQKNAIAVGALAVLAIAAIAASSRGGGGGGGGSATQDYRWEWDQFYNEYRQLVWACRGVQTGQFAETWHCAGKLQLDSTWPSK